MATDNPKPSDDPAVLADDIATFDGVTQAPDAVLQFVGIANNTSNGVAARFDMRTLATQATLAQVLTSVDGLEAALAVVATQTTAAAIKTALDTLNATLGGTWDGLTGTGEASPDIPVGARLRKVELITTLGGTAEVTILGKGPYVVDSDTFEKVIPGAGGLSTSGAHQVAFTGNVARWSVDWTL